LDVFDAVEVLLNNSLIQAANGLEEEPRFNMLQTIRDYALDKLDEKGELETVRALHGTFFAGLAEHLTFQIYSPRSNETLNQIRLENDNYRAVLSWCLEDDSRIPAAAQILNALNWYWYRYGHLHEGRDWSEKVLEKSRHLGRHPVNGLAYGVAATMAMWQGDLHVSLEYGQKSLDIFRSEEEPFGLAFSMMGTGIVLLNQGKDEMAKPFVQEAVMLFRELGAGWLEATAMVHLGNIALGLGRETEALEWLDRATAIAEPIRDPWLQAFAANNKGEVARVRGDFELARRYYEETARYYKEADAKGDQARLVHTFGYLELHAGKPDLAANLFRESLEDFIELGNKRGIAECLAGIAGIAARRGQATWAAPLLAAAENLLTSFGGAWWPADRVEVETTMTLVEESIGQPGVFARLLEQGRQLTYSQSIDYARRPPP